MFTITPKSIVRRFSNQLWNQKDLGAIDQFADENIIVHSLLGNFQGPNQLKEVCNAWLTGFPDMKVNIIALIHENDLVISHWKSQATHQGVFKEIKPSQKSVQYSGVTIYRIKNTKIIEYWAYSDLNHLISQMS